MIIFRLSTHHLNQHASIFGTSLTDYEELFMKYIYINRDCDTGRREEFLRNNAHIPHLQRFSAIDGKTLNMDELKTQGILEGTPDYTPGAVGSALSHLLLWNAVAEHATSTTIFEDDAITCHNFVAESDRVLQSLAPDWDIILWGNNYDTTLTIDLIPGISPCVISFNETSLKKNAEHFTEMDMSSRPFRLFQTFGICGYSISPKGAQTLINTCIPIRECSYFQFGLNRVITNGALDHIMSHYYKDMMAYSSLPPLCISKNDKSVSTITEQP